MTRKPEPDLNVQFQRHLPAGTWNDVDLLKNMVWDIKNNLVSHLEHRLADEINNDLVVTISLRPL